MTPKIRPFLWFDGPVEEPMKFYTSVFKNAKILFTGESTGTFELEGQEFMALNGGPHFAFSPAISFFVNCTNQEEVDELWERLSEGGEKSRCGWLKDKFGVSWQIIPTVLGDMLNDPDPQKADRVWQAMMQMGKIDIAELERAYAGP